MQLVLLSIACAFSYLFVPCVSTNLLGQLQINLSHYVFTNHSGAILLGNRCKQKKEEKKQLTGKPLHYFHFFYMNQLICRVFFLNEFYFQADTQTNIMNGLGEKQRVATKIRLNSEYNFQISLIKTHSFSVSQQ